ncbi:MAG: SufS family cysteine desulfurase [Planctomycetota bacterium]|nr:SufS family cysteine desulfurase [Planctomycetota bacterium]
METIRDDFPILNRPLADGTPLVYLDSASSAQKPQVVIDALSDCYERYYANAHRGVYQFGVQVYEALEGARERISRLIGAEHPEEVVFTSGTTMSINMVAQSWGRSQLSPGDEVLVNEMEHHANLVPWQQVATQTGAVLRHIPMTDDGRLDLERLDECLTPRTRLVAVTGMSNVLGTVNPIERLVEAARAVGALVLVDGAQSVPHAAVDVSNPQVDFLAFSGHKLYGPSGVGVLYGRREWLEQMDPFLFGGNMISEVGLTESSWAELPAKFEAGTLPVAQAIALGVAVDYVVGLGFDEIGRVEQALLEEAQQRLSEIPDMVIHGPAIEHKGAIVSFSDQRVHPHDMAELLKRKGVAVRAGHHCTMPLHSRLGVVATTRASFAAYNDSSDVDVLVDAIQYARKTLRRD